jgi:hypothetical protein
VKEGPEDWLVKNFVASQLCVGYAAFTSDSVVRYLKKSFQIVFLI